MSSAYNLAVVGATGAVGKEMFRILDQRNFPIKNLRAFASEKSKGKKLDFKGEKIKVENLASSSFKNIDIALFSAGASISRQFSPLFAREKAVVIDNSSAFRMDEDVPLIVPEVNPHAVEKHKGIIANPNCSTIQLVVAVNPLHKKARIKRMVISTFQSVSGTGKEAIGELKKQTENYLKGKTLTREVYPHQIAFNLIPHIGSFLPSGYTEEEMKLVNETRKIMGDPSIAVTATCVRVPVFVSHSETVTLETEKVLSVEEVREILSNSPGVIVEDEPENNIYPLPINAQGKDEVFVGRIRKDESAPNSINMWIVADNLRKGAALNTIQIAELLVEKGLV
ncbi:aspartate-semialdehyde dehydrogenase [Candidatus Aerophobetes bacterium]|uniref:Aspartate-semialdehyde dehydrogenase n=1 Tax=Aerophobetes bacterium TaxID=2030807 RepID=A0A662DGJ0_UNCAE|nr:MAG: aspartate-semialdehyde dehydrogenase [Candidatus Aerophobetes bacterium]